MYLALSTPRSGGPPAQLHHKLSCTNTKHIHNSTNFSTTTMLSEYAEEEIKVSNTMRAY
jgi:hypothetical protein